jgi:murein DD-endopeptidase MepM/ murein hydrolase activator NlpD
MGYAADVKALTADISRLTDQINQMNVAISLTGKGAVGIFAAVRGALGAGGQKGNGSTGSNRLAASFGYLQSAPPVTSMDGGGQSGNSAAANAYNQMGKHGTGAKAPNGGGANFSALAGTYSQMGKISLATSALQAAATVGSTIYNMVPDSSGVVNRAGSYYQAALRSPGMARAGLAQATFSALRGGITSIGSDANVGNILANAGYAPGGVDYLSASKQVRGAATYLGMQNENAASAIAGLQGGPMSAQLYQYGITTMDDKGNAKSVGDIAQQLYKVMFPAGATAKSVQSSIRSGYAGLNLQGLGMNADQQQMMSQALIDIAAGKNPDLASAKSASGNQNPFDPMFRANTSSTQLQGATEKNIISGLGAAAGTIETFNRNMEGMIVSLSTFKGYLDGLQGNPQGAALKQGGTGLLKIGKQVLGGLAMVGGAAMIATGAGALPGAALVATGAGLAFGGGGTPGYGSSFGGRNMGSEKGTSSLISYGYGAREAQGGNWSSTGGVHQGTDYDVPSGTSVVAVKEGIVSNTTLSADYGQAVIVDHEGGYSSIYAHLSSKQATPGTRVFQGQEIGKSGKSGNATGPHLHFEVWHGNNNPVEPGALEGAGLPVATGASNSSGLGVGAANSLAGVINAQDTLGNIATSGGGEMSFSKGTGDKKTWATKLLTAIGAPISESNITALTTWQQHEGGHWNNSASFNPLNTTLDMGNSQSMNSVGVKRYNSWDEGITATVNTLTGSKADARGYSAIVNALKSGASTETILTAVSNSAWMSGKTGQNSYKGFKGGGTPGSPGIPNTNAMDGIVTPSSVSVSSPSGGNNVVNFNVYLHDVSDAQAMIWAKKVESYISGKKEISAIGGK